MTFDDILVPNVGIYSITIRSEFNGFCQWYIIHVERAPDAEFASPSGYVLVSSAENVSTGGVSMSETYMPKLALDIQKLIIVATSQDEVPTEGPTSKVPIFNYEDMAKIAINVFDIGLVFNTLLAKVGANGTVSVDTQLQGMYTSFGEMFSVPPHLMLAIFAMRRITPQQAMGAIYAGMGLLLKQTDLDGFVLTDLGTAMSGDAEEVSAENIVSINTTYDYRNIPKTQSISFDNSGGIVQDSVASSVSNKVLADETDNVDRGLYHDNLMHRASPGSDMSQAVGLEAHIFMPSVPLLAMVMLRDAVANSEGVVTIKLGDRSRDVKLSQIRKVRDSLKAPKDMTEEEKDWDYAAAVVTAKRMFMERMQANISFSVLQASTAKNAVVDASAGNHFGNIRFSGGDISLQKAVISTTGIEHVTEEGSLNDTGFVTGLTIVMQAGITTSTITYINLSENYEGVF